jgi:selenocysteine-specific elongation factor
VRVRVFNEFVRMWLPLALPLQPGDRFVLRESGRDETVGGGVILDVDPVLRVGRAAPSLDPQRVVAERGWVDASSLGRLLGTDPPTPTVGRWVVDPVVLASTRAAVTTRVEKAGAEGIDLATLSEHERAALSEDGLVIKDGRVFASAPELSSALLNELEEGGCSPPSVPASSELRALHKAGLVVDCEGVWFATAAVDHARSVLAALLNDKPEGITVGEVRDALGSSRKHVIPLLTHLDATGVTRRRGDVRIAGPLLGAPVAREGGD